MLQIHPYKMVLAAVVLLSTGIVTLMGPVATRGQTQGEMNRTAGMEYKKADAAMNAAYKKLMSVLDDGKKARLRKAQTAWLKFRDAEGAFRASKVQGGSLYPGVLASHLTTLTQERTQALKDAHHLFTTDGEM
jgi:uncharacterized protein YecT (DUF1311 family)